MRKSKRAGMRFEPRRLIDPARRWYVVATVDIAMQHEIGRADRDADKALSKAGVDVWMPSYRGDVVRHGRVCEVDMLFFPGYLFAGVEPNGDLGEEVKVLRRCRHVAAILGVDRPLALPHLLVQAIADAFTGDVKSERVQAAALFRVGEMALVRSGPFATFFATVTGLLATGHIKADVEIFGRAVPVEFEPKMLGRLATGA